MRAYHEFGPVFDEQSRVLILGSFPSVKSREAKFYYGHPANRFWKLMAELAGKKQPLTTAEKIMFLHENHVALWDVVAECDIEASKDSSITNVSVNDIGRILAYSPIETIAINGRKAYDLYNRLVKPGTGREAVYLPSTSAANAAWSFGRLKEKWSIIRPCFESIKESAG